MKTFQYIKPLVEKLSDEVIFNVIFYHPDGNPKYPNSVIISLTKRSNYVVISDETFDSKLKTLENSLNRFDNIQLRAYSKKSKALKFTSVKKHDGIRHLRTLMLNNYMKYGLKKNGGELERGFLSFKTNWSGAPSDFYLILDRIIQDFEKLDRIDLSLSDIIDELW